MKRPDSHAAVYNNPCRLVFPQIALPGIPGRHIPPTPSPARRADPAARAKARPWCLLYAVGGGSVDVEAALKRGGRWGKVVKNGRGCRKCHAPSAGLRRARPQHSGARTRTVGKDRWLSSCVRVMDEVSRKWMLSDGKYGEENKSGECEYDVKSSTGRRHGPRVKMLVRRARGRKNEGPRLLCGTLVT